MAHTLDGQGDRQAALPAYEQSVALFRETGDQWALAHPLSDLALRAWDAGRLHEALGLIQEYLGVFRQLRSLGSVPMALGNLTFMAVGVGDLALALRAAQEKAEIEASRGLPIDRAYGLATIGFVHLAQGNLAQAQSFLDEALVLAGTSRDQSFVAEIHYHLGLAAYYNDRLDEAAERMDECCRLGGGTDRPGLEAHARLVLGQIAARREEYARALALIQESLAQIQDVRPRIPARLEGLAQVWLGLGQAERAGTLLGAASRLRQTMGCPIFPVEQPGYAQTLAGLRASLDTATFATTWSAGEAMSIDESVACGLATPAGKDIQRGRN